MSIITGARRVAATGLGSVLLATGVVGVAAPQAQAVTPICTKTVSKTWTDGYGYKFSGPVAAASNGSLNCQLGPGNSSSAVRALQNSINRCYNFADIAVDGIYGPGTKAAVAKVQRYHGISDDGLYGPSTRAVFNWIIVGSQGPACHDF
ncbi:peptidoglycan-binding domain-containing protein [Streptomyces sp. WAC05374]|uniref:peptidoglycan-binding domain-containing protein n=1 Tax=Streptomyces sp. WAC05374 TaxID=2487420 RepID=UPI00135C8698|nr:peptidoglycan-binding domain-containing protein [Streptomyces sp. WAC05374]